jgi:protein gp37
MSDSSKIEWTDASWNPIAGCTPVSPGCTHCYAAPLARRLEKMGQEKYNNTAVRRGQLDVFTGWINFDEAALQIPLHWKRSRMIFVNSMSDLFHEAVPFAFVDRVFDIMALTPQHRYQILTKRPQRMLQYFETPRDRLHRTRPLPNVWLGTSVEDQKRADERIPWLLNCPAAIHFLSCEPLLGPIDLKPKPDSQTCIVCGGGPDDRQHAVSGAGNTGHEYRTRGLQWVIAGGESGPHARPMHPAWARQLRNQCLSVGVPFFFKQWGEWSPIKPAGFHKLTRRRWSHETRTFLPSGLDYHANEPNTLLDPGMETMYRVGKKAAGRLLDGIEHNALPP